MSDIEEDYEFEEEFVEDEMEEVFSGGDKTLNDRLSASAHGPSISGSFKDENTPLAFDLSMTNQPVNLGQ